MCVYIYLNLDLVSHLPMLNVSYVKSNGRLKLYSYINIRSLCFKCVKNIKFCVFIETVLKYV